MHDGDPRSPTAVPLFAATTGRRRGGFGRGLVLRPFLARNPNSSVEASAWLQRLRQRILPAADLLEIVFDPPGQQEPRKPEHADNADRQARQPHEEAQCSSERRRNLQEPMKRGEQEHPDTQKKVGKARPTGKNDFSNSQARYFFR